ncbi:MAG: 50S ribosomal protein L30 [Candidatus Nanoarchaeia archaeon]
MVEQKTEQKAKTRIAVIRVRGDVGLNPNVRKALDLLRLYKKNYCVILPNTDSAMGSVYRVKDFVTFGELAKETFIKLMQSRARIAGDKPLAENFLKEKTKCDFKQFADAFYDFKTELKAVPGLKQFFRLHPPIGGFERAGIKSSYAEGGALGYRGKDINKLIERMIR